MANFCIYFYILYIFFVEINVGNIYIYLRNEKETPIHYS